MSDTTRVQLAYAKETAFNTKVTAANLQIIRKLSEDLALSSEVNVSGELNADRQTLGIRRVRSSTAGPVNYELSYGTYDDWIKSALCSDSDWGTPVTVTASTISAASADNSISDSANGFGSIEVNEWIKISGFTGAAIGNNGYAKVATTAAGKITVAGKTLVTAAAGDPITIVQGASIVNGTALDTYNLERKYADLTQEIALFKGMAINQWSVDMPVTGAITGAFNWMGASEESLTTSGGTGYTNPTTTRHFTSMDKELLLENEADMDIRAFNFSLDNQLHQRLIAGPSGVVSMGSGAIRVEGSMEAYYASKAIYEKYVNETVTKLAFAIEDPDAKAYIFDFPQVAFGSGNRSGSQSPDVLAKLSWTAYKHPTEAITIRVVRFPAA